MLKSIALFSGNANPQLAAAIAHHLEVPLGRIKVGRFSDGEISVEVGENVRGIDAYVVQSTCTPVNDSIMELLIVADALRRASAASVTAVIPYYGYARQDRKVAGRTPITAKLVADLISTAHIDRVVTLDLHAGQIQGFYKIPGDSLTALHIICNYIRRKVQDGTVVTTDLGYAKGGRNYAAALNFSLAFIEKRRVGNAAGREALTLIGSVADRDVLIVDDLVDTAGSVAQAVDVVRSNGARDIYLAFTHPVLSPPAIERLSGLGIKEIVTTDTLPLPPEKRLPNMTVLTVAELLGEVIMRSHEGRSVGELFNE